MVKSHHRGAEGAEKDDIEAKNLCVLCASAVTAHFSVQDLLEKVVAFIVDEYERRKIFHLDLPDRFHA